VTNGVFKVGASPMQVAVNRLFLLNAENEVFFRDVLLRKELKFLKGKDPYYTMEGKLIDTQTIIEKGFQKNLVCC
jgi:hypothetical protein